MLIPLFFMISVAGIQTQPAPLNQQPSTGNKEPNQPIHLKILPADAWEAPKEPKFPDYPPLAHAAGIQGDILVLLVVGEDGKVLKANAVQGVPQLRAIAEAYLSHLAYSVKPGNGPGPWAISITMRFDRKRGIGFAPTGQEITMHRVPVGALRFVR